MVHLEEIIDKASCVVILLVIVTCSGECLSLSTIP